MINYREIIECDSQKFLELLLNLDKETNLMMLEVGERKSTLNSQTEEIRAILSSKNSTIILALDNEQPVGFIMAEGGNYRRNFHCCYLVIGILKEYSGKSIGKTLFSKIIGWSQRNGISRYELTVMCHNVIAIGLYKKMGFDIEGVKKNSLFINGKYINEYYMSKIME